MVGLRADLECVGEMLAPVLLAEMLWWVPDSFLLAHQIMVYSPPVWGRRLALAAALVLTSLVLALGLVLHLVTGHDPVSFRSESGVFEPRPPPRGRGLPLG